MAVGLPIIIHQFSKTAEGAQTGEATQTAIQLKEKINSLCDDEDATTESMGGRVPGHRMILEGEEIILRQGEEVDKRYELNCPVAGKTGPLEGRIGLKLIVQGESIEVKVEN